MWAPKELLSFRFRFDLPLIYHLMTFEPKKCFKVSSLRPYSHATLPRSLSTSTSLPLSPRSSSASSAHCCRNRHHLSRHASAACRRSQASSAANSHVSHNIPSPPPLPPTPPSLIFTIRHLPVLESATLPPASLHPPPVLLPLTSTRH